MQTSLTLNKTHSGLSRRGARHWGVLLAVLAAVVMAASVSAVLTIERIDAGTVAAGGGWPTVTATQAAKPPAATGR